MARERAEQQRLVEEEHDFERIMSLNLGPMHSLDDDQEVRVFLLSLFVVPGVRHTLIIYLSDC